MRRSGVTAAIAAFIVASALTGCEADEPRRSTSSPTAVDTASPAPSPSESASAVARPTFDPPTRFDAASTPLPAGITSSLGVEKLGKRAVLHGSTLFVAEPARLQAIDTLTGRIAAIVEPENKVAEGFAVRDPAGPPVLTSIEGAPTVLVTVSVTVPGQGTTPARAGVELIAVRVADATRTWSVLVDAPDAGESGTAVIGVTGTVAVIRAGKATYGIDVATKAQVWKKDQFSAATVAGDTAVGVLAADAAGVKTHAAALNASNGTVRWADKQDSYELVIQAAGPKLAMITGRNYSDAKGFYRRCRILRAASCFLPSTGGAEGEIRLDCLVVRVSTARSTRRTEGRK